jgi:lysophospholipase L1-like esterase
MKDKRSRTLLFLVFGALVCVALLELVAGIANYVRRSIRTSSNAQLPYRGDDDYLRYYFAPNYDGEVQKGQVHINSQGFRGAEQRDARNRVACVGDSVTFGWHASKDAGAYPSYLAKELADLDVDVVNAGLPRSNSMDVFDAYVTRVQQMRPDVIVIIVGWNDISYQLTSPVEISEPQPIPLDAFSTVQLARLILHKIRVQSSDERVMREREQAPDRIRWQYVPVYGQVLRSMITLMRARGSSPVLVTLPHYLKKELSPEEKERMLPHLKSWPGVSYDGWLSAVLKMNDMIREVAANMDVPLVECADAIESRYFTDICHLNDEGNEILAKRIAPRVREILTALPR